MTNEEKIAHLRHTLQMIRNARDFHAEHGMYPDGCMDFDQCFDDWAADIAETTLQLTANT